MNAELDKIFEFLTNTLKCTREGDKFTKVIPGPTQQIIINGQRTTQQEPDKTISITYIGEGTMSEEGSLNCMSIWGFDIEIDGHLTPATEYVTDLEQFKSLFS